MPYKDRETQLEAQKRHMKTDKAKKTHKAYLQSNKTKVNKGQRARRYNTTPEQIDQMYDEQNHTCKICHEKNDKLVIDHDHETGKIRGLLCNACNWGLGNFKDSVLALESTINYLNA